MLTRVSAVQLPFAFFSTPQEFADLMRVQIEAAAEGGAELILLPHLASLMLFGMFDFGAEPDHSLQDLAARQNLPTPEWLSERAGYVQEFYLHLFQSLAGRVERWLVPGTVLETDGNSLYLTAYVLNPAGEIVGRQRQINPTNEETQWGVTAGDSLRVLQTEIGDLGIVIGNDSLYPEIARALVAQGANILLHPAALKSGTNTQDPFDKGAQAYLVRANLVGRGYRGRSAILALVNGKWDVLAQAGTETAGEILTADLNLKDLL